MLFGLATLARPVGGALADRMGGSKVTAGALAVTAVGAIAAAFELPLPATTVVFLSIAAALGVGNGSIFALVGTRIPSEQVGSVTGVVGAAGGLGHGSPPARWIEGRGASPRKGESARLKHA